MHNYNPNSNPNHILSSPNSNPDPDNSQHYLCLSDLNIPKKYIGQARCIKTNYPIDMGQVK